MAFTGNGVSRREEQVEFFRELQGASDVCNCITPCFRGAGTLGEKFCAQRQEVANVALDQPSREGIVALAPCRIEGLAAAAVGRPWPPALLDPQGKSVPGASVAKPTGGGC